MKNRNIMTRLSFMFMALILPLCAIGLMGLSRVNANMHREILIRGSANFKAVAESWTETSTEPSPPISINESEMFLIKSPVLCVNMV